MQCTCGCPLCADSGHSPNDTRKQKDRLAAVSPKSDQVFFDQAAAWAFRFLRQPSKPIKPRPVANSGSAPGSGTAPRVETEVSSSSPVTACPYDLGARDAGFFPIAGKPLLLLQVNGLITAVLVELCSPHFVHALVLGSTEGHWCSESKVQVLEIFESLNELFGIEIRPIALQRGD